MCMPTISTRVMVVKRAFVTLFLYSGSAVCFAFGQTGAGKTYTLLGTKSRPGLYRLAAGDLLSMMRQCDEHLTAIVSYYEIYCNRLYDLLNKRTRYASCAMDDSMELTCSS